MFRKIFSFLGTKIGISLIVSLIIVASAFAFKDTNFFKGKSKESATLIAGKEATREIFEKDTDNDGLKDWEETLYGTDIHNSDTKGNGLGDAEEVKRLKTEEIDGSIDGKGTSTAPTATDKFSRELFIEYVEAKRAGKDITPELSARIAEEVLSKKYDVDTPVFDEDTLTTLNSEDPAFLRAYGNSVGKIISEPIPENTQNELYILEEITARESMSPQDKADLEKLLARYTKMRDGLVALKVPLKVAHAHTQLIRGIDVMRDVVTGIQDIEIDPISALPKVSLYEDGIDLLSAATLRLRTYFANNNVSFTAYEAGVIFMQ